MIRDLCDWVADMFEQEQARDELPDVIPEWINETEIEWRMRSYGE